LTDIFEDGEIEEMMGWGDGEMGRIININVACVFSPPIYF